LSQLSGEEIWQLLRLTWITQSKKKDHWKKLKIPALATLYNLKTDRPVSGDLPQSLEKLNLPLQVIAPAGKDTGFVHPYQAYWNSLRDWCVRKVESLRSILEEASSLGANDQDRLQLMDRIAGLGRVSTPKKKRTKAAADFITPLVACIDPKRRFPMINGQIGVKQKLARLGLSNRSLREQANGLIGLIGLRDAFAVDTMTEDEIRKITKCRNLPKPQTHFYINGAKGTPLPTFDDAERVAVQQSATITYRNRHNGMTNSLRKLFQAYTLEQGTDPDCRYDVLIKNYDKSGRDLLIEAKPDHDKGSIRIAIGQLLDYRRFLPNQIATDLAVLTISQPTDSHIELMLDLQITVLWFGDEECSFLLGKGKAWQTLKANLKAKRMDRRS
jgi:hypothetical protein